MDAKDLINWGELSRGLAGSRMNIRRNRIPNKYKEAVNKLIKLNEKWIKEIDKNVSDTK